LKRMRQAHQALDDLVAGVVVGDVLDLIDLRRQAAVALRVGRALLIVGRVS
jgi:hypothetical protein